MWEVPKSAKIVSRPKLNGIGDHWGVLFPSGRIAHLTPSGVAVVDGRTFSQGRPVKVVKDADRSQKTQISKRLNEAMSGQIRYQLLSFNCQDFANWLIGEKPRSPQIEAAFVVLGVVALFFSCSLSGRLT